MVPDDADTIASELRLMSSAVDVVFTMGGIGPTLDDVTLLGVARAFNKTLVRCVFLTAVRGQYDDGDDFRYILPGIRASRAASVATLATALDLLTSRWPTCLRVSRIS